MEQIIEHDKRLPAMKNRPGAGRPQIPGKLESVPSAPLGLASRADLRTGARLQPQLYARYCALERRIGHTLSPSGVPLPDLTGIPAPHPDHSGNAHLP